MISVVIPVYNGEKFLAETYERLCRSEEKNLELLFVNDGSTDKSAELIKKFQQLWAAACRGRICLFSGSG